MVRFNTSIRQDLIPPQDFGAPGARDLGGQALYTRQEVVTVLDSFRPPVILWTKDSNSDVFLKLGWTLDEVARAIRDAVTSGRFIRAEWCEQAPNGPCAACDAYEITRMTEPHKIYVKFAISKTGMILLIVSCHESNPKP